MKDHGGTERGKTPRLVLRSVGSEQRVFAIEGAPKVIELVGQDLFAAFLKCFRGADRLITLEHLLCLNMQHVERDSTAYNRNRLETALLLTSAVYEMSIALQELGREGVAAKMKNSASWETLDKTWRQWRGDSRLGKVRNQLGFHLGEIENYRAGTALLLSGEDSLVLTEGGRLRHSGHSPLSTNVLLSTLGLTEQDLKDIFGATKDAHSNLPNALVEVFGEVLRTVGVPIVDATAGEVGRGQGVSR